MKPTFTIGVFAIIHGGDRRVLLCHRRAHDLWNLPGGVLEHGEASPTSFATPAPSSAACRQERRRSSSARPGSCSAATRFAAGGSGFGDRVR